MADSPIKKLLGNFDSPGYRVPQRSVPFCPALLYRSNRFVSLTVTQELSSTHSRRTLKDFDLFIPVKHPRNIGGERGRSSFCSGHADNGILVETEENTVRQGRDVYSINMPSLTIARIIGNSDYAKYNYFSLLFNQFIFLVWCLDFVDPLVSVLSYFPWSLALETLFKMFL